MRRARLIFTVSALWPESAVRLGLVRRGSAAHRLSASLERFCYRNAWLVTGQSSEIVGDISARFPGTKTFHLSNGVDSETFRPDRATAGSEQLLGRNGRCLALYAGLHGLAQGLELLVDAAAALPSDADLELILMGDGPKKLSIFDRVPRFGIP